MYAIVKTGGKQYRVEKGQTLLVERLPDEAGAQIALEPVLYRSEDTIFDADGLKNVKVEGKVLEHVRGEKLRVFKFKPKRGYKRRTGHRQELNGTGVRVTLIEPGQVETPFFERPGEGRLVADDIARAVMYAVTQPPHVDVNEMLIRPVAQDS